MLKRFVTWLFVFEPGDAKGALRVLGHQLLYWGCVGSLLYGAYALGGPGALACLGMLSIGVFGFLLSLFRLEHLPTVREPHEAYVARKHRKNVAMARWLGINPPPPPSENKNSAD